MSAGYDGKPRFFFAGLHSLHSLLMTPFHRHPSDYVLSLNLSLARNTGLMVLGLALALTEAIFPGT